ncbi:integrase catalytic domain-containing protein [Trichonephila clavipes]|nr:integrase catalytic domain-containing protein [Trichonephila clavipes]
MLIFVITQRLDDESRKQYEMELHSNDLPKWNNFLDFLIKKEPSLRKRTKKFFVEKQERIFSKIQIICREKQWKNLSVMSLQRHTQFLSVKMFHEMSVEERSNKDSVFGYIVTGSIQNEPSNYYFCNFIQDQVDRNLTKFWDLEAIGIKAESSCDPDDQAMQHFKSSVRFNSGRYEVGRFIRDPTLYIQYSEILKEYESQGIIERVLETEKPTDRAVFYLPHQAVFRQESLTTKMRIVFDASSHEDGQPSLNDCIWSDIRSNQTDPYKFQVYRFKRVMFGVNVSPFLLSATIKHHIENYREQYPAATEMLDTCLYVDDVISGADDISQALKVSKDAETIMKNASMKLRKWNSNDQTLMRTWEREGLETHPRHPDDSSKIPSSKVLGIPWDVVHDYFTIDVKGLLQLDTSKPITRIVLQSAGKYTIQLGSCHPTRLGSNAYYKNFGYGKLKIPRKILDSSGDSSEVQIHTFSDASQKAYGAAAFLRVKHKDRVSVDLVTSKSRIRSVQPRAFFWTDSQVTLHWIKGPSHRWKPFVVNRIREIQSLTDPNSWFHCSGKDNPADLLTRGISVDALTTNSSGGMDPRFYVKLTSDQRTR